jgi:hypothetical protein
MAPRYNPLEGCGSTGRNHGATNRGTNLVGSLTECGYRPFDRAMDSWMQRFHVVASIEGKSSSKPFILLSILLYYSFESVEQQNTNRTTKKLAVPLCSEVEQRIEIK